MRLENKRARRLTFFFPLFYSCTRAADGYKISVMRKTATTRANIFTQFSLAPPPPKLEVLKGGVHSAQSVGPTKCTCD